MYNFFINYFFFKKKIKIKDETLQNDLQKEKLKIIENIIDMKELNDNQIKILHLLSKDSLLDILKVFIFTQKNLIEILLSETDESKKDNKEYYLNKSI
jgi:hypothetical protein